MIPSKTKHGSCDNLLLKYCTGFQPEPARSWSLISSGLPSLKLTVRPRKIGLPNIHLPTITSWWLNQPIWKICSSKWVHLPKISGVKFPKIFELPPPRFNFRVLKPIFFLIYTVCMQLWLRSIKLSSSFRGTYVFGLGVGILGLAMMSWWAIGKIRQVLLLLLLLLPLALWLWLWLWPVVVGSRNVGSCGGRPRLLLSGDHVVFQNCDLRIWYGCFQTYGYPKMDGLYWFILEDPIKMDDLGVRLFSEPPIYTTWKVDG